MFVLGPHTREEDYSLYVAAVSKVAVGMVGTATKGEIGVPTFISNQTQFANIFGDQHPDCIATYSAMQYLQQGNQLWFSRVAGKSVKSSSVVLKSDEQTPVDLVELTGKTPGTAYDDYKAQISNVAETTPFAFDLTVIDKYGRAVEKYVKVSLDSTSPSFIETVLASKSKEFVADVKVTEIKKIKAGTFSLSGGNNGVSDISSADYIGSPTTKVGLQTLTPGYIDINLIAVPGITAPEVVSAACTVAQTRGDALAIVDPPLGLDLQEVVDWHNGAGTYTDHQAFNSSYGALYWAWQEIYDSPNDVKVWTPPSGHVIAAMAYSASVSEIWFAPAGLKRGLIQSVLRSEYNPDQGEQQLLYTDGNNINPIIKHPQAGIAIFGQKTLQRQPSATDRVNVRLLLNYLKKVIAGTAAYLAFDPNDRVTWNEFEDLVEPVLRNIKNKRGLYDYRIQMDATTVTSDQIDGYAMPGKVFIKPTKAAEDIPISFVVTRTGAEFLDFDQV